MPLTRIKNTAIGDGGITTAKLADGSVTTVKVADSAVNSAKIGVDVIAAEDLAANSVTVSEITDGAVTGAKLADNLNYDSGTLYLDSTNNKVGIGTTSPTGKLEINGSDNALFAMRTTGDTANQVMGTQYLNNSGAVTAQTFATGDSSSSSVFRIKAIGSIDLIGGDIGVTGAAPDLRIDSSGNVGISKTAYGSIDTDGFWWENGVSKYLALSGTGTSPLYLNRNGSDGGIVNFYKSGTVMGSIQTKDSRLFISGSQGSTPAGIYFGGGGDILPASTTNAVDNSISLGGTGHRWKDLYLSGGAFIGGTGSANYLDDYEEGSWTPNLSPSNGSFSSITYSTRTGRYTKIGNTVTLSCRLNTSAITIGGGSGNVQITNLPFNTSSNSAPGTALSFNANWASGAPAFAFLLDSSGTVRLHQSVPAGSYNLGTPTTTASLNTGSNSNYVYFVLTYETT